VFPWGLPVVADLMISTRIIFIKGITHGEELNSPIDDANPSVTICHLGNIAQRTGGSFHCDPETGRRRTITRQWNSGGGNTNRAGNPTV
jgi:hypothetical protein